MSAEKIYVGKLTQRTNNFNEPETKIWLGPQDWEKLDKLRAENNDSVNLVIKLSKEGKPYMVVDTWKPNTGGQSTPASETGAGVSNDDLPF